MESLVHFVMTLLGKVVIATAEVLVPLLSNGRWRSQNSNPSEEDEAQSRLALSHMVNGQRVVTDTGMLLIGVAFYAVVGSAVIFAMA